MTQGDAIGTGIAIFLSGFIVGIIVGAYICYKIWGKK